MTMGAGAPMLGDLKEINLKNDGRPMLNFELEANNFEDQEGNVKKGQYFEDGWVDQGSSDQPGFWENLMSGGKLQRQADARRRENEE
jgi:hypothetical protein